MPKGIFTPQIRGKWTSVGKKGKQNGTRHKSNTFGFTSTFGGDLILNPISLIRTIFIISLDNVASFDIASFFDILTSIVTARAAVRTVFHPNSACLLLSLCWLDAHLVHTSL